MHAKYPGCTLFAAGWSLGANILVTYLAEQGDTRAPGSPLQCPCSQGAAHSSSPCTRAAACWPRPTVLQPATHAQAQDRGRAARCSCTSHSLLRCAVGMPAGEDTPIEAAVSMCNPFELTISNEGLKHGFNQIYDINLANSLKNIFAKHELVWRGVGGK